MKYEKLAEKLEKRDKMKKMLKNMEVEELKEIKLEIEKLITEKTESKELVLYTHMCKDSSNHHLNKYKHWAKKIISIDTTKTNGYAFAGEWLNVKYEHKLPINSVVVEVCHKNITAYVITKNGKEKIDEAYTDSMSNFIEKLNEYMEEI